MARIPVAALLPADSAALSLVDWWPLRAGLLVASAGLAAALLWLARRTLARATLGSLVVVLVLLNVLLAVNAYYGYYLTAGQAFGFGGPDQSMALLGNRREPPKEGVVVAVHIPGRASHFQGRDARVYVPPAWFSHPRPRLPVVEMLHGVPGAPTDWVDAGSGKLAADQWAAGHRGVAPIMVMPDVNGGTLDDTECVNSGRGQAETYLTQDVPNFVQSRFFTQRPGKEWGVAGLSEGGSCSLVLGLRHPDLYSTIADYGGLLGPRDGQDNDPAGTADTFFGGSQHEFDAHEPANLLRTRKYPGMRIYFGVGSEDPQPIDAQNTLSDLARKDGIDVRTEVLPGRDHTFDTWRDLFGASLPWINEQLGLVPNRQVPSTGSHRDGHMHAGR